MKTILIAFNVCDGEHCATAEQIMEVVKDVEFCECGGLGDWGTNQRFVDLTAEDCEWAASATDSDKRFDQKMAAHLRKATAQIRGAE